MLLITQLSTASSPSSQVGPNILFEHRQSSNVSDKILHTYKTPDKDTAVCILIATSFGNGQEWCQAQDEIESRLKSGNACYPSIQDLLSSSLLPKNLKIKIYRTIILPVVLYGCETWSLTLREERRLRMFENRVLSRIFVPKRDEVKGEWGKLHNDELSDLYSSANIVRVIKSRRISWAGRVARTGEKRGVYRCLVGKHEG